MFIEKVNPWRNGRTDGQTDAQRTTGHDISSAKNGKFSNSRAANSDSSGPIRSIITLIQDLIIPFDPVWC